MNLLYGRLVDMNDINELYRPLYFSNWNMEKEAIKEISSFQQISLTNDGRVRGFDIPAMWGHYGDSGNGACIILDKRSLLNSLRDDDIYSGDVLYVEDFSSDIYIDRGKAPLFDDVDIRDYFFKKSYDWSYEQEFRILRKSKDDNRIKLNIDKSFVGVIIHRDKKQREEDSLFNSESFQTLSNIVGRNRVLVYGMGLSKRSLIDHNGYAVWST